jgi:beta-glucanase (GH16 family)
MLLGNLRKILLSFAVVFLASTSQVQAEKLVNGYFGTENGWTRWNAWSPLTYDFNYWENLPVGADSSGLRLTSNSGVDGNGGVYQAIQLEGGKTYNIAGKIKDLGSAPNSAWLEFWITEDEPVNGTDVNNEGGTPGFMMVNANTWSCDNFDTSLARACNVVTTYYTPSRPGVNTYYFVIKAGHFAAGSLDVVMDSISFAEYRLVWSDEFNGSEIDRSNWSHETFGGAGSGNNELQQYTDRPANSFVENGNLVIQALREPLNGYDYTSARMVTAGKRDFLYGRMEARIKVPVGQGFWPAFWMMPTDGFYGGWSASGEIDIMETVNTADFVAGSIHYGDSWPNNTHSTGQYRDGRVFGYNFHTYAVEWEPTEFRWYIDDIPYATQTGWWSANGAYPAPFNQRFFLILNLAIGGVWPGPPDGATQFPAQMLVDYVRVYQREPDQRPYGGAAQTVPGKVEAEFYDIGGPTVALRDTTLANEGNELGNTLRPDEPVDLGDSNDTDGSASLGWIDWGEWTEYTIDVQTAGTYRLDARVASPNSGRWLQVKMLRDDSETLAGPVQFNSTGGWTNWSTVTLSNSVELERGEYVLRFEPLTNDFNVNWFDLVLIDTDEPPSVDALVKYILGEGPQPFNPDQNTDNEIDIADVIMLINQQ